MHRIPDNSVDMILCDLPYGTTNNEWDSVIPLDQLWSHYVRIIKDNGAIVLTAYGSFTHKLISSNEDLYRYKWIWLKNTVTNPMNAKNRPMGAFEEVLVFSKGKTANRALLKMNYFPQGLVVYNKQLKGDRRSQYGGYVHEWNAPDRYVQEYTNYPTDVLKFNMEKEVMHPSQKPLDLFEYLIRTYTRENEVVLDNCMGSGTTAIACLNTNRRYVGFETNRDYYTKSLQRIKNNVTQLELFS
ncbi:site-specific DNA-methyltransferase [Enterococcus hulanensis]|uniref:DNA-methyltransferase n=1 Tax=Enterococcus hulanensis TaxID=2559929 RepID=UPI001A8C44AF|nr:site-specific DNA-methyltransferase [Enterococcus hulanensis]MBO0456307.1 site-specific DNA-methyltransferase [Enterococcus hulanensis]